MTYYFLREKKKIPSLLAYGIIMVVTVALALFLNSNQKSTIVSRASKTSSPEQIRLSNLTESSVTVSFITSNTNNTLIKYGEGIGINMVKFDDRDINKQTARVIHYFTLSNLQPNTVYSFQIIVEGKKYSKDEYRFRTLNKGLATYSHPPIFGKILDDSLRPIGGALIKLQFDNNSNTYTALSKNSGEWIISLPIIIDDENKSIKVTDSQTLLLTVVSEKTKKSTVKTKYADSRPLRTIVLGNDYDYTNPENSVLGIKRSQQQPELITYPKSQGIISSQYPTFRGISKPNTFIELVTNPHIFSTVVTTDNKGNWQYTSKDSVKPGAYSVYAKEKSTNRQENITFYIIKSGEAVLGEATPSSKVDPTPTNTPTPTTIPSPTIIKQLTNTPTPTITVTTSIPTPISPTITKKLIPTTGFNNSMLIILASGISLFGLFLVIY
jgi:hypothetical protein